MTKCDNFNLKKPCANCPFRKEGAIELRPGRVKGIVKDLKRDDHSIFVCHKTLDSKQVSACMGALGYLWREGRRMPVMARLALVYGLITKEDLEAVQADLIDPIKE